MENIKTALLVHELANKVLSIKENVDELKHSNKVNSELLNDVNQLLREKTNDNTASILSNKQYTHNIDSWCSVNGVKYSVLSEVIGYHNRKRCNYLETLDEIRNGIFETIDNLKKQYHTQQIEVETLDITINMSKLVSK